MRVTIYTGKWMDPKDFQVREVTDHTQLRGLNVVGVVPDAVPPNHPEHNEFLWWIAVRIKSRLGV